MKNAINADTDLQAIKLTATSSGATVTALVYPNYTTSVSGGATETLTLGAQNRGATSLGIGGSVTAGDVLTVTVLTGNLSGGQRAVSYTVLAADNLATIAAGLANAINTDTNLQALGVKVANVATLPDSQSLRGTTVLPPGTSLTAVSATAISGNSKTNAYAFTTGGTTAHRLLNLNGNTLSDGTNSYAWDS